MFALVSWCVECIPVMSISDNVLYSYGTWEGGR